MYNGDIVLFAVIGAIFLGAAFPAFFLGRRQSKLGLSILGLIWVAFTGALFFGMNNGNKYEELAYLFALIGISAPVGLGGLIGSLVGWAKSGNGQHEQSSSRAGHTDTASPPR
ncbi:hypothetical protein QTO30_02310 [Yoonia sp. GPGPB17]|uniref:hypothetical protein n=1 Tax=Yoonia sp. GPGPB17 TaxID=3026147 RepID=UPI0030C5E1C3